MKAFLLSTALIMILPLNATAQSQPADTKKSDVYIRHTVVKNSDGSVIPAQRKEGMVTFYYFDPERRYIRAASDLTIDIMSMWDLDGNNVIDNREFYSNAMVAYEPMSYSERTYQDINQDGFAELTREEYTVRLQKIPAYSSLNTDGKDGLTIHEFTGVGFQDADLNNNNQVSFDELRAAFYAEQGLIDTPRKINP